MCHHSYTFDPIDIFRQHHAKCLRAACDHAYVTNQCRSYFGSSYRQGCEHVTLLHLRNGWQQRVWTRLTRITSVQPTINEIKTYGDNAHAFVDVCGQWFINNAWLLNASMCCWKVVYIADTMLSSVYVDRVSIIGSSDATCIGIGFLYITRSPCPSPPLMWFQNSKTLTA